MGNRRLRGAMLEAELTPARLAVLAEVDAKTVQRWLTEDRMPYPVTRHRVARILDQQETYLWPSLLIEDDNYGDECGVAGVWPTRAAISSDLWHELFTRATRQLDILVYTGSFLTDTLDLAEVLRAKTGLGARVRVLVGSPEAAAVRLRADELGLPWLPERCRTTADTLHRKAGTAICLRQHQTTLYASHFRFDDLMLINVHSYRAWSSESPVFRVEAQRSVMFDYYAAAFERVWMSADSPIARSMTSAAQASQPE